MIVLFIVCILLICLVLDYTFCMIYCSYKKKKSSFQGLKTMQHVREAESKEASVIEKKEKTKGKKIVRGLKSKIFRFADGFLRVMLLLTAYIPFHCVRRFLYKTVFKVSMAENSVIYYGAEIRSPWNLYIDEGAIIGDKAILDARKGIYIGKNVNISTGVWIWTYQHDVQSESFAGEGASVFVMDRAWLSCRSIILPGVIVGEGSVIAAGGVCTKSTEPYKILSGVPCKVIGERNEELNYKFQGDHMLFL